MIIKVKPKRSLIGIILTGFVISMVGCQGNGPPTYTVKGDLQLEGGDISLLSGGTVEAALESDPTIRAAGEIKPDGSFTLETLQNGAMVKGAREGKFQVRIVLPDDDAKARRLAAKEIAPRFLSFDKSELSLKSPSSGEIKLKVSKQ